MNNVSSVQEITIRRSPENQEDCHTKVMPVEWRYRAE